MTRWVSLALALGALVSCSDDDPISRPCASCSDAATGQDADAHADASPGEAGQDAAQDAATDAQVDAGTDASLTTCLTQASGLTVSEVDLDGFPPYALHGCRLAYLEASGALALRDLVTGSESIVAPASESPRRPSLSAAALAWEATDQGKAVVRVLQGGATQTMSGTFDHAREPRVASDALVFTGFSGASDDSDSDVYLHVLGSNKVSALSTSKGQQRFPAVSAAYVAWSDFGEDPSGVYSGDGTSLANVVVFDRKSAKAQTVALPGKQAFPMLSGGDRVGFLDWLAVHPVPKLQDYSVRSLPLTDLSSKPTLIASVQSEAAVRPSQSANRVEWVVRWGGKSTFHRAALDGASPPVQVSLGNVAEVHAPAGTEALSVVATRSTPGGAPITQAIAAQ